MSCILDYFLNIPTQFAYFMQFPLHIYCFEKKNKNHTNSKSEHTKEGGGGGVRIRSPPMFKAQE